MLSIMVIFYIVVCLQVMGTTWTFMFDGICFVVVFLLDAFLVVWNGLHRGFEGGKPRS
jgi:hypothetical protein